jgi:hypothetical protein
MFGWAAGDFMPDGSAAVCGVTSPVPRRQGDLTPRPKGNLTPRASERPHPPIPFPAWSACGRCSQGQVARVVARDERRRGRDSNPRCLRTGVFKTPTLNRSDTPPRARLDSTGRLQRWTTDARARPTPTPQGSSRLEVSPSAGLERGSELTSPTLWLQIRAAWRASSGFRGPARIGRCVPLRWPTIGYRTVSSRHALKEGPNVGKHHVAPIDARPVIETRQRHEGRIRQQTGVCLASHMSRVGIAVVHQARHRQ